MKILESAVCLLGSALLANGTAISLSGPSTTGWIALGANYDFTADQQTGIGAGDIVGNAANLGFLTSFDNAGTSSLTDGNLGFRVRFDVAGNGNAFGRNLWVGIDANGNGSIDVFLGVNFQGSNDTIGVFSPGTGANTSPSTSTVGSTTVLLSPVSSPANYNYRPVDFMTDGGDTNDLTPTTTGDPDYYVSFLVPFANVVSFLNAQPSPISINENTPLRYVVATSTQANSFNQDLGGVNGQVNSTSTWTALGGFSMAISASGQIPEFSTQLIACVGWVIAFAMSRHRSVD
jgi:hypothetical protein